MIGKLLLGAATAAALAMPAAAQDFVITNATVAIGDGSEPMENATVVVREGRIVSAGAGASAPAGVPVIDGTGKWVTPGIFSAVTNLGLSDVAGVSDSNDEAASGSPFSAALDVAPAILALTPMRLPRPAPSRSLHWANMARVWRAVDEPAPMPGSTMRCARRWPMPPDAGRAMTPC